MLSVFMCVCDYCKYFVEIKAALPPPVQIISDLSKNSMLANKNLTHEKNYWTHHSFVCRASKRNKQK